MTRLVSVRKRCGSVLRQLRSMRPEAGVQRTVFNSDSLTIVLEVRREKGCNARASGPSVS